MKLNIVLDQTCGEVYINGLFAAQCCWDADAVGFALAYFFSNNEEE